MSSLFQIWFLFETRAVGDIECVCPTRMSTIAAPVRRFLDDTEDALPYDPKFQCRVSHSEDTVQPHRQRDGNATAYTESALQHLVQTICSSSLQTKAKLLVIAVVQTVL